MTQSTHSSLACNSLCLLKFVWGWLLTRSAYGSGVTHLIKPISEGSCQSAIGAKKRKLYIISQLFFFNRILPFLNRDSKVIINQLYTFYCSAPMGH